MFSIVVTLYNKQDFIKRCIDSVFSQSYKGFELIVVDDGSTDRSLSIALSYVDQRMTIIQQENGGVGFARNVGVATASKEWVAFLDADDAWSHEHLEELRLLIEEFSDVGMVATKSTQIKRYSNPSVNIKSKKWKRKRVDYFTLTARKNGFIQTSSIAIKRKVFDDVGYFKNLQQGEDTEYWSRVCLSYSCAVSNKPTSFYFRGTGGIMEQLWEEKKYQQDIPSSVKEIGPAVSLLVDELNSGNLNGPIRSSVIDFINSRITTMLRISLYNGQINGLLSIGEFYIDPLSPRYKFWRILTQQPLWILLSVYNIRSFVRTLYHILFNNK